ncbi:MAG: cation:proton antiporter [Candidatus Heimdallarchaeota archaeon]|nr:cation:proton antiporter [Candidatus Heimdallarchaeota archaeon]
MAGVGLLEVGILFAVLAFTGSIAIRINKSVIPFYMLGGVLVSSYVLGRVSDFYVGKSIEVDYFVKLSAEMGIVLLLFYLGLEFNIGRLFENRKKIGIVGLIDLTNLFIGIAIGFVLFRELVAALLIGGIVYISSSAIITKSLVDLKWIANDEAEPILGVLVFEDLFIAIYMVILSLLLVNEDSSDIQGIVMTLVIIIGFIVSLVLLVYFGSKLFQKFLDLDNDELFVLRSMGLTFIIAGFALFIGVSEAVAAFFVGMGFSSTKHVKKLETSLQGIRDIFAGVFFFWIGLNSDPLQIMDVAGPLIILIIFTTVSKFATGYLAGKIYGLRRRRSIKSGLALLTRGEFSLIIAALAVNVSGIATNTILTETIPSIAVAYVFFMSIIGTLGMEYSSIFEKFLSRNNV